MHKIQWKTPVTIVTFNEFITVANDSLIYMYLNNVAVYSILCIGFK